MQHAMELVTFPQGISQHNIRQYVDDTSFMIKVEETNVNYLVGILYKFGITFELEINWHKSVVCWCSRGWLLRWVGKYQWKWVATKDLSKLLGMPFGLHLEM